MRGSGIFAHHEIAGTLQFSGPVFFACDIAYYSMLGKTHLCMKVDKVSEYLSKGFVDYLVRKNL